MDALMIQLQHSRFLPVNIKNLSIMFLDVSGANRVKFFGLQALLDKA